MYADYAYYRDVYGGKMSEASYAHMALKADTAIDYQTQGRAAECQEMAENIKMCACVLADAYFYTTRAPLGVKSESNDGGSVTYSDPTEIKTGILSILREYLSFPVNLLYRGYDHALCR